MISSSIVEIPPLKHSNVFSAMKHSPSRRSKRDSVKKLALDGSSSGHRESTSSQREGEKGKTNNDLTHLGDFGAS